MRIVFPVARLRRSQRGVALVEFALALPLVLGLMVSGFECANYVLAANKVQRLATMMADLLAQNGDGPLIAATEAQVYDLFDAVNVSAQPYDIHGAGRVIMTVAKGVDADGDGTPQNQIINQQFDGTLVSAAPLLGCHTNSVTPVGLRALATDEVLIHVQVSYQYRALFPQRVYDMLHLQPIITRTAVFRARSKDFDVTPDSKHPDKGNCATTDGL